MVDKLDYYVVVQLLTIFLVFILFGCASNSLEQSEQSSETGLSTATEAVVVPSSATESSDELSSTEESGAKQTDSDSISENPTQTENDTDVFSVEDTATDKGDDDNTVSDSVSDNDAETESETETDSGEDAADLKTDTLFNSDTESNIGSDPRSDSETDTGYQCPEMIPDSNLSDRNEPSCADEEEDHISCAYGNDVVCVCGGAPTHADMVWQCVTCPATAAQGGNCDATGIVCEYDATSCECVRNGGSRTWRCEELHTNFTSDSDTLRLPTDTGQATDTGSQQSEINVSLIGPADDSNEVSTTPNLSVTVSDSGGDTLDVTFYGRKKASDDAPWTLIALPDTQYLSQSYADTFTAQTQWIVTEQDNLNIQMVMHEGDITNGWNDSAQWNNADTSLSLLMNNNIPLTLAPGDWDHEGQTPDGLTTGYEDTFPSTRFSSQPWWGGSYNNNTSNYVLLTIGSQDYLFMSLDFCPSNDEIVWADSILSQHSDRKAILSTHAFIDENGDYSDDYGAVAGDCSQVRGDTSYIWSDLVYAHDNLQIVLCGHMHLNDGERHQTVSRGADAPPVHQILANYQMRSQGGGGLLRIMTFYPSRNEIEIQTYTPLTDEYETDEDSRFTLEYDMNGTGDSPEFQEIGNVNGVASGDNAEYAWTGLESGTMYEWRVTVSNSSASTTSTTWEFTTIP